jgi:hypothetical protein
MPDCEDAVNHPAHYTFGRFEVVDVLEDWFGGDPLFYNASYPKEERMYAAARYLKEGHNSAAKVYILDELKPENPELYEAIEKIINKESCK